MSMTLAQYQEAIDNWIETVGNGYFSSITNVCMLAEEVGEVSRLISRGYGDQTFKAGEEPADLKSAVADELADVLFIVGCLANDLGVDLGGAIEKNFNKKNVRDNDRFNSKD